MTDPLTGSEATIDALLVTIVAFSVRLVFVMVQEITSPICGVILPPGVVGRTVVEELAALVQAIVAVYWVKLVAPDGASDSE